MFYPSLPFVRQLKQTPIAGPRRCGENFLIPLKKDIKSAGRPLDIYKNIYPTTFMRWDYPTTFRWWDNYAAPPGRESFLLESCRYSPKTGRFSFIGAEPFLIFKSKGSGIQIIRDAKTEVIAGNPIDALRSLLNKYSSLKVPGITGFTGGAVGYFAYDCSSLFERLPKRAKDDLGLPDMFFMFVDTAVVFDHLENKVSVVSNIYPDKPVDKAYDEAAERIERFESSLRGSPENSGLAAARNDEHKVSRLQSTFTKSGFESIVRRAKEYIAAGDIYQANLSQRFCIDIGRIDPLVLYEHLSGINPSPFACYLDLGELKIVSSSPERLLRVEDGFVQTRPIAGTRPRGKTPSEDLALSCELILSDKERAEHIMLVDLERNDLGRVCEYGSVKVNELMVLEDYSHVIHIVSNVVGSLKYGKDRFDLIAAAFPGGTITGCPKIRCMEIIDELEPVARNIYTGSVGHLDFNGDMDLNIAIRTLVIKGQKAYAQVGAGIVADSDPEREYYETLYKAEALFKAVGEAAKPNDKVHSAQNNRF